MLSRCKSVSFGEAKPSFAPTKLWFAGIKLSFGAAKQKEKLSA
ncbi:hypothetical protein GCWU000325_01785 [Alloprevotella tannerae ATCC 51259]|uniref:Uncharacterized protein n=1 Tax=Alloprevotella tannerae ATCC 51259 TaxID=626522 RepID=C9LHT1_9BACT|nr:hypothetical protein GCWU000325_01785 [Alloprevotella tannerae ATCC 51259]